MTAWYNEHDPYAAQWIRNLIEAGHVAPGVVDERDIRDVRPGDLAEFTQCHFFAGLGIWSHALRRAGWPDSREIWTGSCPCQPFSAAGKGAGFDDERHLWPAFHWLIDQCRPSRLLGEQVASKDGLQWLDLVSTDLEASGYTVGATDLCAAGVGGAHLRQRLYFVGLADPNSEDQSRRGIQGSRESGSEGLRAACERPEGLRDASRMADALPTGRAERGAVPRGRQIAGASSTSRMEHPDGPGQHGGAPSREQSLCVERDGTGQGPTIRDPRQARSLDDVDWLLCRNPAGEPSWRPVEPGSFPLHHGIANRMGKLRAYGNALDAETATGFVEVVMEYLEAEDYL